MSDGMIFSLVCLGLLVLLLPFFVIIAMLSRIRHMLTRLERSVDSLRTAKEVGIKYNRGN
jgi:hypothetical protein